MAEAIPDKVNSLTMWLTRSIGVNLHPTSLPAGGSAPRRTHSSTGWLPPAPVSGRCCRSTRRTSYGSPYASASAFAAWAGLLADPDAPVARSELRAFERANAYWIDDWIAFAGAEALADQVRFQREWSALRAYAANRGVGLIGDVPIYVAAGSCDHAAHPGIFLPGRLRRRCAARPAQRPGPELGQPALRLGRARARRGTAGGSSG